MPPLCASLQDTTDAMEESKELGLGNLVIPYGTGIASATDLAAAAISALRMCTALAEKDGNYKLAERMLHFAEIHQDIGERLLQGEESMAAKVELREQVLSWYLTRAINADGEKKNDGMPEGEQMLPQELSESARQLLGWTKARVQAKDGKEGTEMEKMEKEAKEDGCNTLAEAKTVRNKDRNVVETHSHPTRNLQEAEDEDKEEGEVKELPKEIQPMKKMRVEGDKTNRLARRSHAVETRRPQDERNTGIEQTASGYRGNRYDGQDIQMSEPDVNPNSIPLGSRRNSSYVPWAPYPETQDARRDSGSADQPNIARAQGGRRELTTRRGRTDWRGKGNRTVHGIQRDEEGRRLG